MIIPDLKTPLLWMLGLGLVAALATAGIERTRAADARTDAATARKDFADCKLSVSETTRILQAANDRKAMAQLTRQKEAADAAKTREAALRGDADVARAELDRLRGAVGLAARRDPVPGAAADSDDQHAATQAVVFLECAAAFTELARTADGHAGDQQTLTENWPR